MSVYSNSPHHSLACIPHYSIHQEVAELRKSLVEIFEIKEKKENLQVVYEKIKGTGDGKF